MKYLLKDNFEKTEKIVSEKELRDLYDSLMKEVLFNFKDSDKETLNGIQKEKSEVYTTDIKNVIMAITDIDKYYEITEEEEKEYVNESGVCPKCKEQSLYYESVRFEGEQCYFPYKCSNCNLEGEEWYTLEFIGHNIYNENGDLIEI